MHQQKQTVNEKAYHDSKLNNNSLPTLQQGKMEEQLKLNNQLQCETMMIDAQEAQQQKKEWALFSIPVRNYIASIQNQTIIRTSSRKGNITTWVYICKADFLTAYNHTFAVYLAGLLNREFDIMAQVVSLPIHTAQSTNQQEKSYSQSQSPQYQKICGYQMVYRFDKYEPTMDIITNQSQQQPMVLLLHRYISQQTIKQVLLNYKPSLTQQKYKQLQSKLINQNYQQQQSSSSFEHQQHQPEFFYIINTSSTSTSSNNSNSSTPISGLNKQSQKFQFYVQHTNRQDQLDILMFEINLMLTLHLKQYHLYHDFKDCGGKFVQMMRAVMRSYPWFKQYAQ